MHCNCSGFDCRDTSKHKSCPSPGSVTHRPDAPLPISEPTSRWDRRPTCQHGCIEHIHHIPWVFGSHFPTDLARGCSSRVPDAVTIARRFRESHARLRIGLQRKRCANSGTRTVLGFWCWHGIHSDDSRHDLIPDDELSDLNQRSDQSIYDDPLYYSSK